MYVEVIPFFLVANVVFNDTNNRNLIPEFTFVNTINVIVESTKDGMTLADITFTVTCQQNHPIKLTCHTGHLNITSTEEILEDDFMDFKKDMNKTFDINFSKNGVENLIVPTDMNEILVNGLKNVASLLNVGVDLSQYVKESLKFTAKETFPLGVSDTSFNILPMTSDNVTDVLPFEKKGLDYELLVIPKLHQLDLTNGVIIHKVRNVENCDKMENEIDETYTSKVQVKNSIAKLYITKKGFFRSESMSEAKRVYKYVMKGKKTVVRKTMDITLDKIEMTEKQLPSVTDGATISIVIDKYCDM